MAGTGGDDVEQVAMLSGMGIGSFSRSAPAVRRCAETNVKTLTGCVSRITDQPVASFLASSGEVASAYGLCTFAKTAGNVTGGTVHAPGSFKRPCVD